MDDLKVLFKKKITILQIFFFYKNNLFFSFVWRYANIFKQMNSIYKCDYNTSAQWQFCVNLESIASVQDGWDCCMKVNTENQVDCVEYSKEEAVIILYG